MTDSLLPLVEEMRRWLKDRGAVFTAQLPSGGIGIIPAYRTPDPDTLPTAEAETRFLFVVHDASTPALAGAFKVEPDLWEHGLETVTKGAERIFVRYIQHIPAESGFTPADAHPEYIRLRLAVVPASDPKEAL